MIQFQKTKEERNNLKVLKADWEKSIRKKYPEDDRPVNQVWKSNLSVNSKFD